MASKPAGTVTGAKASPLSRLLYEGRYLVPWHQRKYDWKAGEHVRDFLSDIKAAAQRKLPCHFLGTIMLVNKEESGVWEINDGQQRVVTYSLACAHLCRFFQNKGDLPNEHLAMRNLFVVDEHAKATLNQADDLGPRLSPSEDDKQRFEQMIRGKNIGVNGNLAAAWDQMNKFFSPMSHKELVEFFDFMLERLEVACLYVPNKIDPNIIFESLNARGKPLEEIDLIRNHLYSFFNADERQTSVHRLLERTGSMLKTQVGQYARCYFQCRFGALPTLRFYRGVRDGIGCELRPLPSSNGVALSPAVVKHVYALVEDFTDESKVEVFRTIVTPARNEDVVDEFLKASKTKKDPRNLMHCLQDMQGYTVTRPMFFALLNRYISAPPEGKEQWGKFVHHCTKWLTSFIMRVALTEKFEPSRIEDAFSECAQKVMSLTSPDISPVVSLLRARDEKVGIIDNKSFREKVSRVELADANKARKFLYSLARYIQPDLPALPKDLTVEHILPKSPEHLGGWKQFTDAQHKECRYLLGNLTLLDSRHNKSGPNYNGSYDRKVKTFQNSAIRMNKKIVEYYSDEWSPENVKTRQKRMLDVAVRAWALDFSE